MLKLGTKVAASALFVTAAACNHHTAVDLAMGSAFRPAVLEFDDSKGPDPDGPFPPEIEAANRLAQGFEAYNLIAAHMRDRYLSAPGPGTTQSTLARIDQEILSQQRRLVPIGGSDSHEDHLRATTFVLASSRTMEDIRQAVLSGRVCVRDPRACSLRARTPRAAWHLLGAAFQNAPAIEVKARGEKIRVLVNGKLAATPRSGEVAPLALDTGLCSVIRAEIDGGFSAPTYANCEFAQ